VEELTVPSAQGKIKLLQCRLHGALLNSRKVPDAEEGWESPKEVVTAVPLGKGDCYTHLKL